MIDYGVKINVSGNAPSVMGQLFTISQKLDTVMQKLNSMSAKLGDTFRRTGTSAQQSAQKAESGFKKVSTAIGDARQNLDKLNFGFKGLGSRLAGLGLSIGAVDIGRRILNAGGNEEDMLARLEFALKDKGKAITMNNDLKAFARRAPIPIQDMRQQAGMLAPVFKGQTMKYFKMLGDVVAGSGGDFGNIAYNFAQIKSMGRTYGIDLRQFAMQNIPIWQELAKVLNVPVEKMDEISTSGKITFDVVAKAFENMTKEGGIYFGAMEARAHTFRGQWQIIGNKMQEVWVKFFEKARPYLQQFSNWVEKQIENFDELWPRIKIVGALIGTYFSVRILAGFISGLNTIRKTLVAISSIKLTGTLAQFGSIGSILKGIIGPLSAILAFFGLINYGHGNASGKGYQAMSLDELKAEKDRLLSVKNKPLANDLKNITAEEYANIHKRNANKTDSEINSKIEAIDRTIKQKEAFDAIGSGSSLNENSYSAITGVNTDLSPRGSSGSGTKSYVITINGPIVQIDDNHVDGKAYTSEEIGQIAAQEIINTLTQIAVQ